MKTRINITQKDIDNGKKCGCDTCPVALAIKRRVIKNAFVEVGLYDIGLATESISLNETTCDFVRRFDRYGRNKVKPFSFTIDIPKKFLRKKS